VPLDPAAKEINDLVVASRTASPLLEVESARAGYEMLFESLAPPSFECQITEIQIAGLRALSIVPPADDGGLLVWFHGGGMVLGSPETSRGELDALCARGRFRAITVEYSRTPEVAFPRPQLDAIAATTWCLEHAADLGVDPARVAVGGDSAGGNLAAVCAQRVPGLVAQLLVYPWTDATGHAPDDEVPYPTGYVLDLAAMCWFDELAGARDAADPLVSPVRAATDVLAAVPPALVISAEYDPIREDSRRYAAALRAAGAHVEEAHFEEEMHLFWSMPHHVGDARIASALAASFLRARFDDPGGSTAAS
jgi:acetyl esterase